MDNWHHWGKKAQSNNHVGKEILEKKPSNESRNSQIQLPTTKINSLFIHLDNIPFISSRRKTCQQITIHLLQFQNSSSFPLSSAHCWPFSPKGWLQESHCSPYILPSLPPVYFVYCLLPNFPKTLFIMWHLQTPNESRPISR